MKIPLCALYLAAALSAGAEEQLGRYQWADLARAGVPIPGKIVNEDRKDALLVQNTNDTQLQVRLLTLIEPSITASQYALRGEIKYVDVQGTGFLEMWNVFPPKTGGGAELRFFSRTLGDSGEMGKISGTSDWRPFLLPFNATGSSAPPKALEVNLVLPGPGSVYLRGLELVQAGDGAPMLGITHGAWWSERTGGLIGGSIGAFFGCLAALMAWLASRGKARNFVIAAGRLSIGLGIMLLALGGIAAVTRQPYAVWFPLLLGGVLISTILPGRLRMLQQSYHQRELRRMEAADAV